ncbi:MAG: HAMP domain-containing protein [Candidatus Riflebacteria bacterium]|nr:HAMP domain-containing protein [Candidatus Riflebacteria bacterium]
MSEPATETSTAALHSTFYGSRLFLKFFFWIWFTLILTGILVATYGYFYHFEPEKQRFFSMSRSMIEENGQMLVNAYEKLGIESANYFKLPGSFWLYDADLNMLFSGSPQKGMNRGGRTGPSDPNGHPDMRDFGPSPEPGEQRGGPRPPGPPPWHNEMYVEMFKKNQQVINQYATSLLAGQTADSEIIGGEIMLGVAIKSETGKQYAFICHLPSRFTKHASVLIFRILENLPIFLLATGVLCLWLARYMIKPIVELRTASRSFAQGNLATRITGSAINRFDEIGDLATDFNDMADKIEKMIKGQRRLFGDISHELRSPLARLQISVELLQKKSSDAEQPMFARIEKEISRMNAMIEELLQFTKLENSEISGQSRKISLQSLLQRVCNDASFEGKTRNCTVKLNADHDVIVTGTSQLIERAVENILRNALKFSPENSEIIIELQSQNNTANITIADCGPGIPEEDLQKVFAPFYCLSENRNPQSGGIGLGLAIAQRAIKLHKGQITLKNRDGGGLTASISLPLS